MLQVVVQLVLVALLLFVAYKIYTIMDTKETFVAGNPYAVAKPALAPIQTQPEPIQPQVVASSGPNPPNVAPPKNMDVEEFPEPRASDPMDDTIESADAPVKMRHPERNFGPRDQPWVTAIASGAGTANEATATTTQAIQNFSPELVTNGGMFFGDVGANDIENPNYSAF
jgi:hypothetical protein